MARLPFNPARVAAPVRARARVGESASGSAPADALSVTQASELVKAALSTALPGRVRIVGEISNLSDRNHWYFCLKDETASLGCVCFASAARRIGFPIADGMQVVVSGRFDYYAQQGKLQLYVEAIEPVGQGALELRFRALCEELRRLGYFDDARKKPLPAIPRRVAVVTSRSGAALQDVINTAGRRWRGCELLLCDVRVQGAAAAPEIVAAIEALSRQGPDMGVDAIVLTRGGGSIEDLWAFNERAVADAIYRCGLPLIAAIGHETDTTIAELVADRRCSTPTQAVMTLIPDGAVLAQQVSQLAQRLTFQLKRQAEYSRQRLGAVARHPIFRRPETMVEPHAVALKALTERLLSEVPRRLRADQERVAAMARQLAAIAPQNVLDRGYSYTLGPGGSVLRSPGQVAPGAEITSVLAEGRLKSVAVVPATPSTPAARTEVTATPLRTRRKSRVDASVGPSLFNTN